MNLFKGHNKDDLRGMVDIELRKLHKMPPERNLKLKVSDNAKRELGEQVERGYERVFRPRPLRRAILRETQILLAESILSRGDRSAGTIGIDATDGEFTFKRL